MSQTTPSTSEVDAMMSLAQASVGCKFRILKIKGSGSDCVRLRSRGFCEDIQVQKVAGGRNMICTVCGTRMAISSDLAKCIRGEALA